MHGEYNIIYLIIFRGELGILTYNKCPPFNYLHILKGTVSRILRIQRLAYVPVPTIQSVKRGRSKKAAIRPTNCAVSAVSQFLVEHCTTSSMEGLLFQLGLNGTHRMGLGRVMSRFVFLDA